MKILCMQTGLESQDIMTALEKLGYQAVIYDRKQKYSIINMEEIEMLADYIRVNQITHVISMHLLYNVSVAAAVAGIKYLVIVWDAPYDKMFTAYGRAENCYFSVFDRVDAQRFREAGFAHIMYQPLAVNQYNIQKWEVQGKLGGDYYNDVCFIGSLYDDNLYDKELKQLPDVMKNYFDSIFEEAAFRWDGVNRVYGKTGNEILRYLEMMIPDFALNNTYDIEDAEVFEDLYLVRKLGNIERIGVLNLLAEYFSVTVCTYHSPSVAKLKNVRVLPPIEQGEAFAIMVSKSKINLNISLKGIRGGTPLRVMDIMAAGGFVLTGYCEETAELFEEDKEIAMFSTPEELVEKVAYYLEHEDERKAIAAAGQQKVLAEFTYEKLLKRFLDWTENL